MEIDHLISPPVTNKDYERAMVFLDIIVDKELYTWIKLLPHACRVCILLEEKRDNTIVPGPTIS